jgi:cytochrome c553
MLPRTYRIAILILCFCAFALYSCGEQPAPQAQPQQSTESITEDMGKHFEQVFSIQKAVIRGDLEDVPGAANWMAANHTLLGAPEGWGPHIKELRTAARTAAQAQDFKSAASATASMSRACGTCHEAEGATPRMPELGTKGLPPTDQVNTVPHMLRHYWAIEQMWIGIVNPSEDSWNKGAEALADAPLEPQKMTDNAEMTPDVGNWAKAVHEISDKTAQAKDWDSRARLYGELLATCAQCHQKLELAINLQ